MATEQKHAFWVTEPQLEMLRRIFNAWDDDCTPFTFTQEDLKNAYDARNSMEALYRSINGPGDNT